MATYHLSAASTKSVVCIVAGENVPDNVKYITYKGLLFKRSEAVVVYTGVPDPYEWVEVPRSEDIDQTALVVDGKDLISTTKRTKTTGQMRLAHEAAAEGASDADLQVELDAANAENASLRAQIDAMQAPTV